jgi:hypothetical protein
MSEIAEPALSNAEWFRMTSWYVFSAKGAAFKHQPGAAAPGCMAPEKYQR